MYLRPVIIHLRSYLLLAFVCLHALCSTAQTPSDPMQNISIYEEAESNWNAEKKNAEKYQLDSAKVFGNIGQSFVCSSSKIALGADLQYISKAGSMVYQYLNTGELASYALDNVFTPRLSLSLLSGNGMFEWYTALPRRKEMPSKEKLTMYSGMETGFSVFPLPGQKDHVISPFFGVSCMPIIMTMGGNGKTLSASHNAAVDKLLTPIHAGLAAEFGKVRLTVSGAYIPQNGFDVYMDFDHIEHFQIAPFMTQVRLDLVLPSTVERTDSCVNGNIKVKTADYLLRKKLSGLTMAIGLGQGYYVRKSALYEDLPFLVNPTTTGLFLDLAIGWYLAPSDIQVNFSYRHKASVYTDGSLTSDTNPKGFYQHKTSIRISRTLEVYKFWHDWSGIAFFAGPSLSFEYYLTDITYSPEYLNGTVEVTDDESNTIQPGISAGWEFRPDRLQWIYLRSTIRWMPFLHIDTESNGKVYPDQLEFTGIQLFIMPFRLRPSYRGF